MIVLVAGVIGGLLGYSAAKKRNGSKLDIAQYATGYAIAFMIAGMFLTFLLASLFT